VRSDLELEGITEIDTDIKARECSFTVDHDKIDIDSKLKELSGTNHNIAGWSVLEQKDS